MFFNLETKLEKIFSVNKKKKETLLIKFKQKNEKRSLKNL